MLHGSRRSPRLTESWSTTTRAPGTLMNAIVTRGDGSDDPCCGSVADAITSCEYRRMPKAVASSPSPDASAPRLKRHSRRRGRDVNEPAVTGAARWRLPFLLRGYR